MKKKIKKSAVKPTNTKNKKSQQKNKPSNALKIINKLMPYILTILFVVLLFSLVGFLGSFGLAIKNVFGGVFSNFASYFIPIFMLYHAIMWYYDTKRKICTRRVACSILAVICLSSLQHIITVTKNSQLAQKTGISDLYNCGVEGQGGGVLGGLTANALLSLGTVLAIIIVFLVLALMFLQMFNITPASMVRAISNNKTQKRQEAEKAEQGKKKNAKIKHRNVDIFDDEDDFDEDNVSSLELTDTATLNKSKEKEEKKKYKSADKIMSSSRPLEASSQLKPYDKNKDYSKKKGEDEDTDDLIITSTKLGSEDEPYIELNKPKYEDGQEKDYIEENDDTEEAYYEEASYASEDDDDEIVENVSENESSNEDEKEDTLSSHLSDEVQRMLQPTKKEELPVEKKSLFQKFKKEDKKAEIIDKRVEEKPKAKKPKIKYSFPPIEFLKSKSADENEDAVREELQENARKIVTTLNEFNVKTKIVDIVRGPTVTRYELAPEAGVRVKAIASLVDDIALNLAAEGIRIECPIPGKSAVGIEVPNKITSFVYLKDLLETDKFKKAKGILTCAVGKSISGEDIFVDIEKTPHLLVAGATGMGKSVCINSLLISMLYKAKPDELRLILIDPKRVELSNYNGIPHLLVPVVCEPKKSLGALQWAVTEMENRFETIEAAGVRNLTEFNERVDEGYEAEKMSRIVIVIDELADLKMAVPDIEGHITRLTQKARAAGIHIIIGTQRPSVDVITGLIKNNIPSRIAFRVPSLVDSRTILDEQGAEKLVSRGDMLVKIVGALKPVRVQGSFVTAGEIQSVIDFLKSNSTENYDESVMQQIDSNAAKLAKAEKKENGDEDADTDDLDPEFYSALKIAAEEGKISSSLLQRKLRLGFQRAARIIDQMEECGYIGEANGSKPRETLISLDEYREIMMRRDDE